MSATRFPGYLVLASGIAAAIPAGLLLRAAGETLNDAPGVTVMLSGSALLHRGSVPYPSAARQQGVQGAVVIETTLDIRGNVIDAHVLAGPAELRRTVLESVLQWHFVPDAATSFRQVTIRFDLPAGPSRLAPGPDFHPAVAVAGIAPAGPIGRRIQRIEVLGLPDEARAALIARLPAHAGDLLSLELANRLGQAVRDFDEHLRMGFVGTPTGDTVVQMVAPGYTWESPPRPPSDFNRIEVGNDVQQAKLRSSASPEYPPLARQARIQGIVKLSAVIGKDGAVQSLTVISGHPLLIPAALTAVKQWVYEPTVLNGVPVEVEAPIDVSFALSE